MNVPAINLGAKPRVVFISTMHGNGWGGSEELWGRTAERLIKGNRAQVLAHLSYFPEPVRQREELRAIGCAIETGHPNRLRHLVSRRVVTALGMGRKPYLVRARPDLVVISQGAHFDGAAWMIECADRKIPYAAVSHCFVEGHPFADTHTDPLRRGYEESLRSYFVSEANLRDTRRQIATPLAQGRVVRNPCNVPFTAAPEWPEPKDGVFRIATVARLDTVVKGHDILMEVLNSPKWKARPLHVSLYGKGTNENSLKRLKAMYGLDNVTFMGTTNDVEGIWRDHHALVLTSRWEGLPLAVVEAMLCG
ncbi:MAG: glycosyltransferase family 4 protein, partial [Akkermansiaceae bacterium]|nr:glycosyltransferase family 4 protein [Armatimonadota bacterium]